MHVIPVTLGEEAGESQVQDQPKAKLVRPCLKNKKESWALVAHACNTSHSGGRDQKDQGLKPAQANS
jgi:hypothetical protein